MTVIIQYTYWTYNQQYSGHTIQYSTRGLPVAVGIGVHEEAGREAHGLRLLAPATGTP